MLLSLLFAAALATGCGGKSKPMTAASPANTADEASTGAEEGGEAGADPCGGTEEKKGAADDGADPCGGGE